MPGTQVWSLSLEDSSEEEMATHSGILTWKIPWTEEPGRLQSIGLQRVRQSNSSLIYLKYTWTNPSLIITNFIAIFSSWNHISIWLPPYNFILIHFFFYWLFYHTFYNIYLYIFIYRYRFIFTTYNLIFKVFLFSVTKRIWVEKCPLSLIITIILVRPT